MSTITTVCTSDPILTILNRSSEQSTGAITAVCINAQHQNHQHMTALTQIFHDILEPLYGSQEKALKKIAEDSDRKAYLLYSKADPVGVLVFKTVLSNEFEKCDVTKSLEIKSLFVVNSSKNSNRGIGSTLLEGAEAAAKLFQARFIHVTVSENKTESLAFFQKKKFKVCAALKDKYKQGVTEFVLSKPLDATTSSPIQSASSANASSHSSSSSLSTGAASAKTEGSA